MKPSMASSKIAVAVRDRGAVVADRDDAVPRERKPGGDRGDIALGRKAAAGAQRRG